ncbi:MAG: AhpC/TSA family protein [Myxococcales bacterium]|nr:AhpC/TSA family protein [Myxococcales bacterium]
MLLSEVEVLQQDGSVVFLSSFWAQQPAALFFLRHFACPSCSVRLQKLLPRLHELVDLGVRVVLVGLGSVRALSAFAARMRLESGSLSLVVSPDRSAYEAAGFARSALSTYGPRSVVASLALYALGHGASRADDDGDVTQQGGVLYVERGGRVAYRHAERSLADAPDLNALFRVALRSAAENSGALV